jgi:ribosomal protein S10
MDMDTDCNTVSIYSLQRISTVPLAGWDHLPNTQHRVRIVWRGHGRNQLERQRFEYRDHDLAVDIE